VQNDKVGDNDGSGLEDACDGVKWGCSHGGEDGWGCWGGKRDGLEEGGKRGSDCSSIAQMQVAYKSRRMWGLSLMLCAGCVSSLRENNVADLQIIGVMLLMCLCLCPSLLMAVNGDALRPEFHALQLV